MIHCYTREGDESYTKWHGELIPSSQKSEHHEWNRHDHWVEDHKWLREAMELEREDREYDDKCYEKCWKDRDDELTIGFVLTSSLIRYPRWEVIRTRIVREYFLSRDGICTILEIGIDCDLYISIDSRDWSGSIGQLWLYEVSYTIGCRSDSDRDRGYIFYAYISYELAWFEYHTHIFTIIFYRSESHAIHTLSDLSIYHQRSDASSCYELFFELEDELSRSIFRWLSDVFCTFYGLELCLEFLRYLYEFWEFFRIIDSELEPYGFRSWRTIFEYFWDDLISPRFEYLELLEYDFLKGEYISLPCFLAHISLRELDCSTRTVPSYRDICIFYFWVSGK